MIDQTLPTGFAPLGPQPSQSMKLPRPTPVERALAYDAGKPLALETPQAAGLTEDPHAARRRKVLEAAEGFESMFYAEMIKSMRKTVSGEGLFGKGAGKDVYEGLFDDLMSREMARSGDLGVARLFLDSLPKELSS